MGKVFAYDENVYLSAVDKIKIQVCIEMELKLLQKKKSEEKAKLNAEQKMALHALQKQMQILEMKEWLFVVGFIGIASLFPM